MSKPHMSCISTFSIVARDPNTGELGIAVQSRFLAVGAAVPWARAGAGAIATQAWANLSYDPEGLKLLEQGLDAEAVVKQLTAADRGREQRQFAVVDAAGRAAAFTGEKCVPWAGHLIGDGFSCQGNILVGEGTVQAMAGAYQKTQGHLADRLLAALFAGQKAGGDSRGQQSAALYVVREGGGYGGFGDRLVDLRVDDDPTPLDELARLLDLHRQAFLTPTPPERWRLDNQEKISILQSLLREVGMYDGAVTGELSFNTRGALAAWCRQERLPDMDPCGEWIPGETILVLRQIVTERRMNT